MGLNSTPLISYCDIKTDQTDLFEDAFGINSQFSDVISLLDFLKPVPGHALTRRVIKCARKCTL